jgi:hypothetical protein
MSYLNQNPIHALNWNLKKHAKQSDEPRHTYALVFHQRLNNNKEILGHKRSHHCLQILMHCPNVLARNFEGQVANSCINIRYPLHVDRIMLVIKQRFERLKAINRKL